MSSLPPPPVVDADRWLPEILSRLREAFHPRAIWIFGSRAEGGHRPDSDLDLLVEVDRVENARRQSAAMRAALADIPVPMDIVPTDAGRLAAWGQAPGTIEYEMNSHGRRVL